MKRRKSRTLDAGAGLVDVLEVGPGPQRGTGYEYAPHLQVAWSQQEVFERDLVYKLEGVLYGPNQSEHFEGIPFEGPHLKTTPTMHKSTV